MSESIGRKTDVAGSNTKKKGLRVLAVDDETSVLEVIRHTLKPEGYDIVTAEDGQSALDMLDSFSPDLVILDINMPGLNGLEVLEKIRESSDTPVIMLSVLNDVDTISDSLTSGADDFISKPFDTRELLARVKAQLNRLIKN